MTNFKNDQNITWEFAKSIAYAEADAGGIPSELATYYVAADGSDANSGQYWGNAFATIQKAINSLPAKGGVVEVGYGTFAGFTINSGQGISIRGRGIGRNVSVSDATVPAEVHPTMINSNVVVSATGVSGGVPENKWINPFDMRDIAVANCTGDGISINNNFCTFSRVSSSSNTGNGINFTNSGNDFFVRMSDCRFLENQGAGMYGATSALSGVQTMQCNSCYFDGNKTNGVTLYGTAITFTNCTFQRNTGIGAEIGGSGGIAGTTFIGCQVEHNSARGVQIDNSTAQVTFIATNFYGDSSEDYGIKPQSLLTRIVVLNCFFQGHTQGSIFTWGSYGFTGFLASNRCSDSAFLKGSTWSTPAASATGVITQGAGNTLGLNPITLDADGAVAIDSSIGGVAQVTLNGNASSSSITNPTYGQVITVQWIQGAGSKTYAWPANCKFAGGAAPVAANATAGYIDAVSFIFNGTNWIETSRSVGIN